MRKALSKKKKKLHVCHLYYEKLETKYITKNKEYQFSTFQQSAGLGYATYNQITPSWPDSDYSYFKGTEMLRLNVISLPQNFLNIIVTKTLEVEGS